MLDGDHQLERHRRADNHALTQKGRKHTDVRLRPECVTSLSTSLEGEPADELAATRRAQLSAVSKVSKGAQAGDISSADLGKVTGPGGTALIGRIERANCARTTVHSESCGIRKLNAIEHVLELDSNLERVPLFDSEVPLEVHRFGRLPLSAEESVRRRIRGPLGIRYRLPCVRVEYDGFVRVEAVAVDIQRIGVMSTVVIEPIHRPRTHVAPVRVLLQLRTARAAPKPAVNAVR